MGHPQRAADAGASEVACKLIIGRRAGIDLAGIREWHSQPGAGSAAQRRVKRILAAIDRLQRQPYAGRPGDEPGTRELIIEGHVAVYELRPDTGDNVTTGDVYVLRVFGPGQSRDF